MHTNGHPRTHTHTHTHMYTHTHPHAHTHTMYINIHTHSWTHLWGELHFEIPAEKLPLKLRVLPDVGGDHALDLTGLEENSQAKIVHTTQQQQQHLKHTREDQPDWKEGSVNAGPNEMRQNGTSYIYHIYMYV